MKKLTLLLILISSAQLYADTIYKTVDTNGHTSFSQTASINATPIEIDNTHSQTKPIKQKSIHVNKKVNTLLQLQRKLNKANLNYDHAKDNYEKALKKALKAQQNLTNLELTTKKIILNKDPKKFSSKTKNDKIAKHKLKSFTHKAAAAEEKKQKAFEKFQQAEKAIVDIKVAISEFHRS